MKIEKVNTESLDSLPITNSRKILQFIVDNMFKFEKGLSSTLLDEMFNKYGEHTKNI